MGETSVVKSEPKELATFADMKIFAEACFKSGLFQDAKSEAQAIVKIMAGKELGISPLTAMNKLQIVNGHIGMQVEVMKILLKTKGYSWEEKVDNDDNPTAAEVTFAYPDRKPKTYRFTVNDAKRAGLLTKDNWKNYLKLMLGHRAFAIGARDYAPEALQGCGYTPEELEGVKPVDITVKDVTPAVVDATTTVLTNSEDSPICPIHNVPFKWQRKGNSGWWSHHADDGWCNRANVEKKQASATKDTDPAEKTAPAASQTAKAPKEWSVADFKEMKDSLVLRLEWSNDKVQKYLLDKGLLTPNGLVTIANRDNVINALVDLCESEGK